jgi:hypothetical protein
MVPAGPSYFGIASVSLRYSRKIGFLTVFQKNCFKINRVLEQAQKQIKTTVEAFLKGP